MKKKNTYILHDYYKIRNTAENEEVRKLRHQIELIYQKIRIDECSTGFLIKFRRTTKYPTINV